MPSLTKEAKQSKQTTNDNVILRGVGKFVGWACLFSWVVFFGTHCSNRTSTRCKESQPLTRARKQDNSNNIKRAETFNLPSQLQGSISARHCGTPPELKKLAISLKKVIKKKCERSPNQTFLSTFLALAQINHGNNGKDADRLLEIRGQVCSELRGCHERDGKTRTRSKTKEAAPGQRKKPQGGVYETEESTGSTSCTRQGAQNSLRGHARPVRLHQHRGALHPRSGHQQRTRRLDELPPLGLEHAALLAEDAAPAQAMPPPQGNGTRYPRSTERESLGSSPRLERQRGRPRKRGRPTQSLSISSTSLAFVTFSSAHCPLNPVLSENDSRNFFFNRSRPSSLEILNQTKMETNNSTSRTTKQFSEINPVTLNPPWQLQYTEPETRSNSESPYNNQNPPPSDVKVKASLYTPPPHSHSPRPSAKIPQLSHTDTYMPPSAPQTDICVPPPAPAPRHIPKSKFPFKLPPQKSAETKPQKLPLALLLPLPPPLTTAKTSRGHLQPFKIAYVSPLFSLPTADEVFFNASANFFTNKNNNVRKTIHTQIPKKHVKKNSYHSLSPLAKIPQLSKTDTCVSPPVPQTDICVSPPAPALPCNSPPFSTCKPPPRSQPPLRTQKLPDKPAHY